MELPQLDNFRELFVNDTAMMDVRAPVEFTQGAFPHTVNLPLMNDKERESVGIEYKEEGQDSAIELGHSLVSGEVKQQRVDGWTQFVKEHPQGVLYCFRGGLRSRITQQWIYENTGIIYPRIKGGYKAMRRFLIDELEYAADNMKFFIVSGRTGIGKTRFLENFKQQVDLEGIYHHRGSAFGGHATPQPSQIDIENTLSIALLKLREQGYDKVLLEDESASIGSRKVPDHFRAMMTASPIVIIDAELEERVDIVFDEYINCALQEYCDLYGEQDGFVKWSEYLHASLHKIRRRLGGDRFNELDSIMSNAITEQAQNGNPALHKDWIHYLLNDYYDPMYDYQLSKKTERIAFRGNRAEVTGWLNSQQNIF